MSEISAIQWTDATFNPWIGCTEHGPECDNCYAREQNAFRSWNGGVWGAGSLRKVTSANYWHEVFRWDSKAYMEGRILKVFAASLADVFDKEAPVWPVGRGIEFSPWDNGIPPIGTPAREVFFQGVIKHTSNIQWILLTKRFEFAAEYFASLPKNHFLRRVWLVFSAGTQKTFNRAVKSLEKIDVAVRGISAEPLLEEIDPTTDQMRAIDWMIVGGESGRNARPMHPDWASGLLDACRFMDVPFFFKQWGEWAPGENVASERRYPTKAYFDGKWDEASGDWVSEEDSGPLMYRVGKKAAGRHLGGQTFDEFPKAVRA